GEALDVGVNLALKATDEAEREFLGARHILQGACLQQRSHGADRLLGSGRSVWPRRRVVGGVVGVRRCIDEASHQLLQTGPLPAYRRTVSDQVGHVRACRPCRATSRECTHNLYVSLFTMQRDATFGMPLARRLDHLTDLAGACGERERVAYRVRARSCALSRGVEGIRCWRSAGASSPPV